MKSLASSSRPSVMTYMNEHIQLMNLCGVLPIMNKVWLWTNLTDWVIFSPSWKRLFCPNKPPNPGFIHSSSQYVLCIWSSDCSGFSISQLPSAVLCTALNWLWIYVQYVIINFTPSFSVPLPKLQDKTEHWFRLNKRGKEKMRPLKCRSCCGFYFSADEPDRKSFSKLVLLTKFVGMWL